MFKKNNRNAKFQMDKTV
jgi:hypothetical protein